jgi:erythromycin esterase
LLPSPDRLSRRNFLLASASAALLSACATKTGEVPAGHAPTMADLLAAQAVTIRNLTSTDPGIKALAKRLSTAQIAGLGEATHGSHEDALLKAVLIQRMVEDHDLRVVLLEANRTGAAQFDAYASGAPTGLLAADAVREAPLFRILKTEVMADLLTWLRGWNAVNPDQRVQVLGIDCQASSADAGDALAALSKVDSGAADALAASLAPILTEEARSLRHDRMLNQIASAQRVEAEAACLMLEAELKRVGLPDAAFTARRAWQGLNAFELETSDADITLATPEYWSRRDVFMADNALALAGGKPAVLWAHNAHVAGGRPGGGSAGYEPTGGALRDALGKRYAALVQEFGEATFLALPAGEDFGPDAPLAFIRRRARPDTLNALTAEASRTTAWFDLANLPDSPLTAQWRSTEIGLDWYGAKASETPLDSDISHVPPARLFDLVVYHPKLTASRML